MKRCIPLAIFLTSVLFSMSGCWLDSCDNSPSGGFYVMVWDDFGPNCASNPQCWGWYGNQPPVLVPTPAATPVNVSGTQQCDLAGCGGQIIGSPTSFGSVYYFGPVNTVGFNPNSPYNSYGYYNVVNGRFNAQWSGTVYSWGDPCGNPNPPLTATFSIDYQTPTMDWTCMDLGLGMTVLEPGSEFVHGQTPSSIIVSNPNFALTTAGGMPYLVAYDENGINTAQEGEDTGPSCEVDIEEPPPSPPDEGDEVASAVSSNGTSVTFPFPTLGDGTPLPPGFYVYKVLNQPSAGTFTKLSRA